MKRKTKGLTLILALVLCMAVLTACGDSSSKESVSSASGSNASSKDSSDDSSDAEGSSDAAESASASGAEEDPSVTDDASGGAEREALVAGVVAVGEDGTLTLTVYERTAGEADSGTDEVNSGSEASGEADEANAGSQASGEADEANAGSLASGETDETNAAGEADEALILSLEDYTDSGETLEYTFADSCILYSLENDVLVSAAAEDVAEGDVLVITTDDEGLETIVIYPGAHTAAE